MQMQLKIKKRAANPKADAAMDRSVARCTYPRRLRRGAPSFNGELSFAFRFLTR